MLRSRLETGYDGLKERLRRRLGSEDLAGDVLQETWLRLGQVSSIGVVQRPDAYLLRIALNIAADRRQAENRRLSAAEVNALLQMADPALDAERLLYSRAEMIALERALDELPPRRRAILLLARVEEIAHEDIARRFGISTRMVAKELSRALDHCSARLGREVIRRFGPRPRQGC